MTEQNHKVCEARQVNRHIRNVPVVSVLRLGMP